MSGASLLIVAALAQAADQAVPMVTRAGAVEGRPLPEHTSPVQALIDAAKPGDHVVVPAGTYGGDLIIDRAITLDGRGRVRLVGSGTGSVVRVRAAGAAVIGVEIDGQGGGDLGRDSAGIHVSAPRVHIADCRIVRTLFGIYLRAADGAAVDRCVIEGMPGRPPGEIGSGIHLWNTTGFTLTGNDIVATRDGIYIQSSTHGFVRGNRARDLRYGLHYMFSDDNVFEDNTFETSAAGSAVMNSRRVTFRRNRLLRNRGFASVGLLLKSCEDVLAEDNLIVDNARGLFLEDIYRSRFQRNVIAMSDQAIVLYDSSQRNTFEGNAFVANFTPLVLVGRRTDTRFDGNYWSDHNVPDLDGDGFADRPYRLANVFDHLRGNLTAADLFARGLAASALGAAERAFPVLDLVPVVDSHPLARLPRLSAIPSAPQRDDRRPASTTLPALSLLLAGALTLVAGARRIGGGA
ncbi:MAG TPA: nitrous oxide reductase family maturation protein NosD [Vicinamibacterales bacterium]|nr:nitrous oxide reductase family maturation protein NosD [Vicinamibacterales bacterium]